MMKLTLLSILAASVLGALVLPIFTMKKEVAKIGTPEEVALSHARDAERRRVLAALIKNAETGTVADLDQVEAVARSYDASDWRRLHLAKFLEEKGRVQAAFELERAVYKYQKFSVQKDEELEAYAKLAERAGDANEAAWARARKGPEGRFRIWKAANEYSFGLRPWPTGRDLYERSVNRHMNLGLEEFPQYRAEIEAFRAQLLGPSP